MLNKKERIEFLEQNYFFEIANDRIAELERENCFIDYELLEFEAGKMVNRLIHMHAEDIENQNLKIENWCDIVTSDLKLKNSLTSILDCYCKTFFKSEIYNMLVVYTETIKDEVLFWKNAR
jgi:hypothetical protein